MNQIAPAPAPTSVSALFQSALRRHRAGMLTEAENLYRAVLAANPGHVAANTNLGVLYSAQGRLADAIRHYDAVLAVMPNDGDVLGNLGNVLLAAGETKRAEDVYRAAAVAAPHAAHPCYGLGLLLGEQGRTQDAFVAFAECIHRDSRHANGLREFGLLAIRLGRLAEAESALAAVASTDVDAAMALGDLFYGQKRWDEALEVFQAITAGHPDLGPPAANAGLCLLQLDRNQQALAALTKAATDHPELKAAHDGLGTALMRADRREEAVASFNRAAALDPADGEVLARLSSAILTTNDFDAALAAADRAVAASPTCMAALWARVQALLWMRSLREAETALNTAVLTGGNTVATWRMASTLCEKASFFEQALAYCEQLLLVDPDDIEIQARVLLSRQALCIWRDYPGFIQGVVNAIDKADRIASPIELVVQDLINLPVGWHVILKAARCRVRTVLRETAEARQRTTFDFTEHLATARADSARRIRVGLLLPVTYWTSIGILLKGLIERLDRTKFELFGYSMSPSSETEFDDAFRATFDVMRDVSRSQYEATARAIAADGIDILLDVNGHTQTQVQHLLALRPAPAQAQIVGYSNTNQAPYVNYLVVDHHLIPDRLAVDCTETVVRLPEMMVGYRTEYRRSRAGRAKFKLPKDGFVFCNFSQPFKFEPSIFDVWMRILRRVPQSVLWLGTWNEIAERNIRAEAKARGVDPARLVFAAVEKHEKHLGRLHHAELVLDTRYHSGGACTIDALWVGVPLLTWAGEAHASRNGTLYAHAIGAPEMITESIEEYEEAAVALATDAERYRALRTKIEANRFTHPLFDEDRFARNFGAGLEAIWRHVLSGKGRTCITVADQGGPRP